MIRIFDGHNGPAELDDLLEAADAEIMAGLAATTDLHAELAQLLAGNDDNVVHIVGDLQHWLDRLGLKIPRALCGVSLEGSPDRPDPTSDSPVCRRCAEINGTEAPA